MALTSAQFSVPTGSALEITDGAGAVNNQSYEIVVKNTDATNPVYLGGSAVTSGTGYQLAAGESLGLSLAWAERLYARATGGAVTVTVLQSKF